jgi:hypothetical protein
MSDEPSLLLQIGIKVPDLLAGFMGGVVNAFVFRRSDPFSIIGSMVVGALTANYLADIAAKYTGTSGGASAFIVGLAGMAVCQGIVEAAKNWRPGAGKGSAP